MSKLNNWMLKKYVAIKNPVQDEEGQGLAEYGLILALVAILCVAALGLLKDSIVTTLTSVSTSM